MPAPRITGYTEDVIYKILFVQEKFNFQYLQMDNYHVQQCVAMGEAMGTACEAPMPLTALNVRGDIWVGFCSGGHL